MLMRLSLIIVTYKSEEHIYDCLDSVFRHLDLPREELEVIVVDNSPESEPMFATLRARYGQDLILIHNGRNGGYGQANNVGLRKSTAPVALIMNPDVRLIEPVMGAGVKAFEQNGRLAVLGMKMMWDEKRPANASFQCTYMMNGYASTLLTAFCTRRDVYLWRWMHVSGSCFFVRKKMFEEVGLFDESVFMYGEEDDIAWRLRHRFGPCLSYDKRLRFVHLAENRAPSMDYETKLLDVAIAQNEKKGYPARRTILNRLRNNRLQLWREWLRLRLGKQDRRLYELLKAQNRRLKERL